ncbi:hypothetical protein B0H10DRAFT_1942804 [Mycena sp. CBHHK59/15]|nr:hypothetical protein B0H10DRAFT_1942804 [Mycena sp. CBHHK59/15]
MTPGADGKGYQDYWQPGVVQGVVQGEEEWKAGCAGDFSTGVALWRKQEDRDSLSEPHHQQHVPHRVALTREAATSSLDCWGGGNFKMTFRIFGGCTACESMEFDAVIPSFSLLALRLGELGGLDAGRFWPRSEEERRDWVVQSPECHDIVVGNSEGLLLSRADLNGGKEVVG